MASLKEIANGFGSLFYLVNPYESMYKTVEDMPHPNVVEKAGSYFFVLIVLEQLVLKWKGKPGIRLNDGLMSIANGFIMGIKDVLIKGLLMQGYFYIYDHHRIYELPWDSIWTWIIAAVGSDLAYYWIHRAAHEVNILWAAHQVHHSSEEYNLTTALRQSFMQAFGSWPFYLPMAFFVPPTHVIIHSQFNLLYQFWIHTEAVKTIGPLEHILNTPQHHRVHHGSNRYCLDKNYAGVLIIWDRMFGTFEWERPGEDIVYGLVDQPQYFSPMRHQIHYYVKIVEKANTMDNWSDKLSAFLKGPGWFPGTPRLGDIMQVPERQNRKKYDPKVPSWATVYAALHFLLLFMAYDNFIRFNVGMSQRTVTLVIGLLIWTLSNIGFIFDKRPWDWFSEILRCSFIMALQIYLGSLQGFQIPNEIVFWAFLASWGIASAAFLAKFITLSTSNNIKKD
ncbi:hypothetical protein TCAL_01416 [Tigriopus californicus]|uniref:Alkylglycerol monooxygenase n=1 Tax=Tigriopus californicus TaxID=6832 RepID=A0A553NUC6_TIGCA|nr:alkylglycerol monooxygenase-like [Tigriopus californicus]TRY69032.1 hypothetical protein TCAL_01416 [Tigriopus californicus]|eukprot:TCALIF_01416-PA protein Name:"Similar to agmo Alkylglycerol monooxygenase (Xenopus tropicalis)" AED:0.07 eAED:0.07 QI:156/1/1/1/1/1/9/181/448